MDIINKTKFEPPLIPLEAGEIPQARSVELEELEDLLQLVVSNQDQTLYYLKRGEAHLYLIWIVIHDFFNLNGLPLVLFVRTAHPPTRFIKCRPDLGRIDFVDKVQESSAAYIKIIKIKELPFCLDLAI